MNPNLELRVEDGIVRAERPELQESRWTAYENITIDGPDNDQMTNVASIEPVPPNGGYAWVCTFAVFLVNSHTWGINSSWAVFMAYFLSHSSTTIKGSHLEYGLIGGLSISQALMISSFGTLVRKHIGARWTMLIGSLLMFLALLTSSFATQIWHLFLSQGFCFGWGMGFSYITAAALLPPWFSTKRSLAYGIATAGAGIGGLVYSIVTNSIIQSLGWAWAYRILAFCSLFANVLASFLLKEFGRKSKDISSEELKFNLGAFKRVEVLLIFAWGATTELGFIILLYSLPTYASSIGLTASQGAISNALLNLGIALGRPLVGYFSDTFGRINMAATMTGLCTIFCFALWIPATDFATLLAFSILAGALSGTYWSTVTPVIAEVVGIKQLASTFGSVCILIALPTTFAEAIAMEVVVNDGPSRVFLNAQLFVGFMFLAGTLSVWLLRCWKISDAEEKEKSNVVRPTATIRRKYWVSWLSPRILFSLGRV